MRPPLFAGFWRPLSTHTARGVLSYEKFFKEKLNSLKEEKNKLMSTFGIITDFLNELRLSGTDRLRPVITSTIQTLELLDLEIMEADGTERLITTEELDDVIAIPSPSSKRQRFEPISTEESNEPSSLAENSSVIT